MLKKYVQQQILLLVFFAGSSFLRAETACTVGIYITSLYDFNYEEKSFSVDFWLWAKYTDDDIFFDDTFDIVNAKSQETILTFYDKIENWHWVQQKMRAVIHHDWNLVSYPFDSNTLKIKIEDIRDTSEVILIADNVSANFFNNISSEWTIQKFAFFDKIFTYNTNYGNPVAAKTSSDFSQVNAEIVIKRNRSFFSFSKLLVSVYIAFIISLIPFGMKPGTDSRLALPAASLFAVVGNKYIADTIIPQSNAITLIDKIYMVTFCAMLLIFTELMISDNMRASGNEKMIKNSTLLDKICLYVFFSLYIALNVFFLLHI